MITRAIYWLQSAQQVREERLIERKYKFVHIFCQYASDNNIFRLRDRARKKKQSAEITFNKREVRDEFSAYSRIL